MLAAILESTRARLEAKKAGRPLAELKAKARDLPPVRPLPGRPFVMAEVKRASPSRGDIVPDADAGEVARTYVALGADAVSCLTEPVFFKARADDFATVRRAVSVPLLWKDFVIDPYQVWESRAEGADLVLLIARVLRERLPEFLAETQAAGIQALVEVHGEADLALALAARAEIIGVNSRDLETFRVDVDAMQDLLRSFSAPVKVAESGIRDALLARTLLEVADGLLIGEEAMRRPELLREIKGGSACG